jgi:outer membrane lipoprotein carrier protein
MRKMNARATVLVFLVAMAPVGVAARAASAGPAPAPAEGDPMVEPAAGSEGSEEAARIADRVQSFYDKSRTYQAEFKQRYTIKAYNRTKDSQGKVTFQKPGKMNWVYTSNGNRVVSDGKLLKVYEDENKQMYEQAVEKSQYPAALAFLVGEGNLRKSFKLRKLDPARANFPGGHVLLAEPKDPTPAYQKMLLYVDAATHQVRRVMLIDAQGNRNRFDFQKPVVNKSVDKKEFEFAPPPGTKVIRP